MTPRVFISYAPEQAESAARIGAALSAAGVENRLATRGAGAEPDFGGAEMFLILRSTAADSSRQVIEELNRAKARGMHIATIRLERAPASGPLVDGVDQMVVLDAFGPLANHLGRIVSVLRSLIPQQPIADTNWSGPAPPAPSVGGSPPIADTAWQGESRSIDKSQPGQSIAQWPLKASMPPVGDDKTMPYAGPPAVPSTAEISQTPSASLPRPSSFSDGVDELRQHGSIDAPPRPGVLGRIDHYELVRKLGEGGMGIVLLVRDTRNDSLVAMKTMRPRYAANSQARHRFVVEARHMQRMNHPNVLKVLDVSDRAEGCYYTMPLVAGGSLAEQMESGEPMFPETVLRIGRAIADALRYSHDEAGVIHRDIKPQNVLIDTGGHVLLSDFGLVRTLLNETLSDDQQQRSWTVGTGPYMPPEIVAGKAGDTRADIYSFGAMLYEMCCGRSPYSGQSTEEVLTKIKLGPPPPIAEINPSVPLSLAKVIEGCMGRELRHRYAHMADVAEDLRRVQIGQEPLGPHDSVARSAPRRRGKLQRVLAVAAMVGVVIALVLLILNWSRNGVTKKFVASPTVSPTPAPGPPAPSPTTSPITVVPSPATTEAAAAATQPTTAPAIASANGSSTRSSLYDQAIMLMSHGRSGGNWNRAKSLLEAAADAGDVRAMLALGSEYQIGSMDKEDLAQAVQWYQRAANAGSAQAMNLLSLFYDSGQGVKRDHAQADEWQKKAMQTAQRKAPEGDTDAMVFLAQEYQFGDPRHHQEADAAAAVQWYRKAADAGNVAAMNSLGNLYQAGIPNQMQPDIHAALEWYRKASEGPQGAAGLMGMGSCYESDQLKDYAQAMECYRKASDVGYWPAGMMIGRMYLLGTGVPKDSDQADQWFAKTVDAEPELGGSVGQMFLGGDPRIGADFGQVKKWLSRAAAAGEPFAMCQLGDLYSGQIFFGAGQNVPQQNRDPQQALAWYLKAADAGNSFAMLDVARMYLSGDGIKKDADQADEWMNKYLAAEPTGWSNVINAYSAAKDDAGVLLWQRKAADAGDVFAMKDLGMRYLKGEGVEKDQSQAERWFQKIEDGDDDRDGQSAFDFGFTYATQLNDPVDAVRWYRVSAAAGNEQGMQYLGDMYLRGEGVEKDPAQAADWFRKAAEGDKGGQAMFAVATTYYDAGDYVDAVNWYRKSAAAGDGTAMLELGQLYENGQGVGKDLPEATDWYRKAAAAGIDTAKKWLADHQAN